MNQATWEDVELHNIVELDLDAGYPGPLVRRIPRAVSDQLQSATLVAEDAAMSELRFVVKSGPRLSIALTSFCQADLFVFRGDLVQSHVRLPAGALFRLVLEFQSDPLAALRAGVLARGRFAPEVWRVAFDGPVLLHGLDRMGCSIAPPRPSQKPKSRWLAYGSSITHGFSPVTRQQCYVAQAARLLGVDALNLGLAGSCFCEGAMADYIASRDDWDFATCELGVNMRGSVEPAEFARRARYLVHTITSRRLGKPLVLITPFPTGDDHLSAGPNLAARNTRDYERALRELAREFHDAGVHLVEGHQVLPDLTGLYCDLVHPSTEGHTLMAQNLAAQLAPLVRQLP